MSSPWLIEISVEIAELFSNYVTQIGTPQTLIELYETIEVRRLSYNSARPPWEQIDQEWFLVESSHGISLNFVDDLTEKIYVTISDALDSLYLRIYGNNGNAFVVYVIRGDELHILESRPELITDQNQGALIELLQIEVFGFEIAPKEFPKEFFLPESKSVH